MASVHPQHPRTTQDLRTRTNDPGHQQRRLLLDIGELAIHLGVTERFVRRLVEERRVPFHKIGKFVRFHPDDIEQWVSNQRVDQVNDH